MAIPRAKDRIKVTDVTDAIRRAKATPTQDTPAPAETGGETTSVAGRITAAGGKGAAAANAAAKEASTAPAADKTAVVDTTAAAGKIAEAGKITGTGKTAQDGLPDRADASDTTNEAIGNAHSPVSPGLENAASAALPDIDHWDDGGDDHRNVSGVDLATDEFARLADRHDAVRGSYGSVASSVINQGDDDSGRYGSGMFASGDDGQGGSGKGPIVVSAPGHNHLWDEEEGLRSTGSANVTLDNIAWPVRGIGGFLSWLTSTNARTADEMTRGEFDSGGASPDAGQPDTGGASTGRDTAPSEPTGSDGGAPYPVHTKTNPDGSVSTMYSDTSIVTRYPDRTEIEHSDGTTEVRYNSPPADDGGAGSSGSQDYGGGQSLIDGESDEGGDDSEGMSMVEDDSEGMSMVDGGEGDDAATDAGMPDPENPPSTLPPELQASLDAVVAGLRNMRYTPGGEEVDPGRDDQLSYAAGSFHDWKGELIGPSRGDQVSGTGRGWTGDGRPGRSGDAVNPDPMSSDVPITSGPEERNTNRSVGGFDVSFDQDDDAEDDTDDGYGHADAGQTHYFDEIDHSAPLFSPAHAAFLEHADDVHLLVDLDDD